jgi:hypothetical protein
MPSRFHDGARRSRILDRKAARRRRGLDGRQRHRDQDCGGRLLVFMRLACRPYLGLDMGWNWSGSFSAWGVTRIIFGILLVCRWSAVGLVGTRWYALVFVGLVGIRRNSLKRSNAFCHV